MESEYDSYNPLNPPLTNINMKKNLFGATPIDARLANKPAGPTSQNQPEVEKKVVDKAALALNLPKDIHGSGIQQPKALTDRYYSNPVQPQQPQQKNHY